jgi:hypothetical protein
MKGAGAATRRILELIRELDAEGRVKPLRVRATYTSLSPP